MPVGIGTVGGINVIDLLFSDVTPLLSVMNQLTDNYRLLVGAAEELTRTPGVNQLMVNEAIDRVENTGTLIDLVIVTLYIKIIFVTEVLDATGLPIMLVIDLFEKILDEAKNPDNILVRPPVLNSAHQLVPQAGLRGEEKTPRRGKVRSDCQVHTWGNRQRLQKKLKIRKELAKNKMTLKRKN